MTSTTGLKTLIAGAALMLSSTISLAENSAPENKIDEKVSHAETRNLLGGLVIGGILGGPAGAIALGTVGAILGSNEEAQQEKRHLADRLDQTEQAMLALQAEHRSLEKDHQLTLARQEASQKQIQQLSARKNDWDGCCVDSALTLHFRTASSNIEQHYRPLLRDLAALARKIPGAGVEITGYSDRRGDSMANLNLSQRRIQAVETLLTRFGVKNTTIHTLAYGDSRPLEADENLEGNFFDRRVDIRIKPAGADYLSANSRN